MIFFVCVIFRSIEEEMYYILIIKIPSGSTFSLSKFADMMSLGELQTSFPLFFVPQIHLMTSYPQTLTVKKLIKMRFLHFVPIYTQCFLKKFSRPTDLFF